MKVIKIVGAVEVFYEPSNQGPGGATMTVSAGRTRPFEDVQLLPPPPSSGRSKALVPAGGGKGTDAQPARNAIPHAIGVLGHELRNPLSSIVAVTASLLGCRNMTEEARRRLAIIARSARRMTDIIERALDYAEVGVTGHLQLFRQPVDLRAVCEEVIAELGVRHPRAAVHLDMSGDGVGHWDRVRVAQVVSNLIANAFVHGSADAPIFVFVRRVGDDVILEVRNRGPVIARDILPTLFEPFRRGADAAASVAGRRAGLGLGLHIVRQIAEEHGGTISARSSAEEGTVFILSLPSVDGGAGKRLDPAGE